MNHIIKILIAIAPTLLFCNCNGGKIKLDSECDSLMNVIKDKDKYIKELKDSILIFSYPADQRYNSILKLIESNDLGKAKQEISALKRILPKSNEALLADVQQNKINKIEEAKRIEEERIKAQGFKVIKDHSVISLGHLKCTFSSFSYGRTFTFGSCDEVNEYSYETADKDCTYILVSMSMSTKSKDYVSVPSFYVYRISGNKATQCNFFRDEYANWTSYGAKIGNYSDDNHDFSKVNSVRYKLASEISLKDSKLPLIILVGNNNKSLPEEVTINYILKNCQVIKLLNREKL